MQPIFLLKHKVSCVRTIPDSDHTDLLAPTIEAHTCISTVISGFILSNPEDLLQVDTPAFSFVPLERFQQASSVHNDDVCHVSSL